MSEYQTNQVLHNNYNNKYINNISAKNIYFVLNESAKNKINRK